jgi:hypothetical protein
MGLVEMRYSENFTYWSRLGWCDRVTCQNGRTTCARQVCISPESCESENVTNKTKRKKEERKKLIGLQKGD